MPLQASSARGGLIDMRIGIRAGIRISLCIGLCIGLLCSLGLPAVAQQDPRAQREREALRRAQATLQQTQTERDGLRAERDTALKDKAAAGIATQAQAARASQARRELASLRKELDTLRAEQGVERAQAAQALAEARSVAAEREQGLQRQLLAMRRERDERIQANAALTTLLTQATATSNDLHQRNTRLHELGIEAVERYRAKSPAERFLQGEPFIGITAVRIENVAEDLRSRIDAQRVAR